MSRKALFVIQPLTRVRLFATQHARVPCPSLSHRVCSDLCPLSQWCHPTIYLILCCPSFLLPSIFLVSESFPMSQFFVSGGQNIGTSASVLLVNIQGWFPWELTGLISLQPKGLSRVSSPQFESVSSSLLSLLHGPTLMSVYDYWKNYSFGYIDFCQQSNVAAF